MQINGRDLTERDVIALVGVVALVVALIASGAWLEMRAKAIAAAKARAVVATVVATQPKPAPPITTSVYVRSIPVRHAQ